MNGINSRDLDNYITGHYGEDQFRDELPDIEDEGIAILESAMEYLRPRAERDEQYQTIGDFEAYEILVGAKREVFDQFFCRFYCKPTGKKNSYCSKNCAQADAEGY